MRFVEHEDRVDFSMRHPAMGLVFELEAEPSVMHSWRTDEERERLMDWLRADPNRWEAFRLLCEAAELLVESSRR